MKTLETGVDTHTHIESQAEGHRFDRNGTWNLDKFNRLSYFFQSFQFIATEQDIIGSFHTAMGLPVVPVPDECHEDDAPDAVEPTDGPGDGMVVLENNLGAAIEVWKMG